MSINLGYIDRVLRFVIGIILIAIPFVAGFAIFENDLYKYGAMVIGIILSATALVRFCPLYWIFGIRTCKVEK